jgi:hypothetical protein
MACVTVNMSVAVACVNGCGRILGDGETYICQQCNDEIDRRADETLGNAENEDD